MPVRCYVICYPNEKRPIGNNWGADLLTREDVQRRLANNPDLNVGIALGEITGIIDVECDSPEAEAALAELILQDVLDRCISWQSLRGKHYLFLFDVRFAACLSVVKLRGIEFRLGTDKQLQSLIPPSRVDGVSREWINEAGTPQPLPESVIAAILEEAAKRTTKVEHVSDPMFAGLGLADHKLAKLSAYFDRAGVAYTVERLRQCGYKIRLHGCPFKPAGHGDGDPVVFVNADGSHGFRCQHAKCAALRWDDLEERVGPLDPIIKLSHDLDANVRDAKLALGRAHNVYQRGGVLVAVSADAPKPPMALVDNGSPKLVQLTPPTIATSLTTVARFRKFDGRSKEWKPCLPPTNVVAAVDAATDLPGVRPILGIVNSPVLRADGSILDTPGYDPLTGLYLDASEAFPPLMSPSDAVAAFDDVLADFPFATPAHRSAAIALVVTMLARPAVPGPAPFFLVDANASRAGKGLLTDVATMIVEGRKAARFTPPTSDDEFRKTITTAALSGAPYVLFDNIKSKFGGQALENALTGGRWTDRLLGGNKSIDLELNWVWCGTSNNAILTPDMIGRTCHIRLDVREERPELRSDFRHANLLGYVRERRRSLAMAALSIPAAYIRAGRPDKGLPAWGGFEGWSALVRNSIVAAGLPDPGETREALREAADDETESLRMLVAGWRELDFPATVAAALEALDNSLDDRYPTLRSAVRELPGDRKNALGQMLKQSNGRVVGGYKFAKLTGKKWAVVAA